MFSPLQPTSGTGGKGPTKLALNQNYNHRNFPISSISFVNILSSILILPRALYCFYSFLGRHGGGGVNRLLEPLEKEIRHLSIIIFHCGRFLNRIQKTLIQCASFSRFISFFLCFDLLYTIVPVHLGSFFLLLFLSWRFVAVVVLGRMCTTLFRN